jgi:ubiquitin-like protein Pup
MSQVFKQPQRHRDPEDVPPPDIAIRDEKRAAEVDDVLTEIDTLLEENAEEFVRAYIQKGGQ